MDVRMIENFSCLASTGSHDYEGEPVDARLARRNGN